MEATMIRNIKPGTQFNKYFKSATFEDPLLVKGDVFQTLDLMQEIVSKTLNQTEKIAQVLKGNSIVATAENVWNFLYDHVQYKLDDPGVEQLRSPNRVWADRKTGVDCDCYSIFISSVLTNLAIPHSLRIAEYSNRGSYQHVYVVVPHNNSEIIIDPVLDHFNKEKKFTKKHDKAMKIQHQFLNGVSGVGMVPGFGEEYKLVLSGLGSLADRKSNAYKQHLINTLKELRSNPSFFAKYVDVPTFSAQIIYALKNWDDPIARAAVLEELAEMDKRGETAPSTLPSQSMSTSPSTRKVLELARRRSMQPRVIPATNSRGTIQQNPMLRSAQIGVERTKPVSINGGLGGFWDKVRDGIKNTVDNVKESLSNVGDKIKDAVQNNPITKAIKNGILSALEKNRFNIATKLTPMFLNSSQLNNIGFDLAEAGKLVGRKSNIVRFFGAFGGTEAELRAAILKGGGFTGVSGVNGLGSAAGIVAAVSAFVGKVITAIKGIDFKKLFARIKGAKDLVQAGKDLLPDGDKVEAGEYNDVLDENNTDDWRTNTFPTPDDFNSAQDKAGKPSFNMDQVLKQLDPSKGPTFSAANPTNKSTLPSKTYDTNTSGESRGSNKAEKSNTGIIIASILGAAAIGGGIYYAKSRTKSLAGVEEVIL
jgi:hypothetical protein